MKSFSTLVLAATAATGVMSAAVSKPVVELIESRSTGGDLPLTNDVVNSAAFEVFQVTDVKLATKLDARQEGEPDPNRNETNPEYVFVLQCTDPVSRMRSNRSNYMTPNTM